MIEKTRKIKGLQTQLKTLEGDASALKNEISNKQREYSQKLNSINSIKEEISKLKKVVDSDFRVSEHAIVRYFERVKGFNIDDIQKEILNDKIKEMTKTIGSNGTFPNDGFSVIIKDSTVTTVIVP